MPRRLAAVVLIAVCADFLLLFGLDGCGLLSVDEPRYASIGREMARSGDWVTPRLWGAPWFEKPALLYWLIAAGHRLGLHDEFAARLPVALVSLAFLAFYWIALRREFGEPAARYSTFILATSAGWVALSQVAVTDLPMSAAFAASMLVLMRGGSLWIAGALMGVAVLGKGLVPLALAVPAVWFVRDRWREWWKAVLACVAVAAPWYVVCYAANGRVLFDELIWRHTFQRLTSDSLQHVQRWWFYVPVLVAGLFPWSPLLGLAGSKDAWREWRSDWRLRFLLAWVVFGLVFFSLSLNKLPGYLLPLMPAVCALLGARLARPDTSRWWLPACGLLLGFTPVIGAALPQGLRDGLSTVHLKQLPWGYVVVGFLLQIVLWGLERCKKRTLAVAVVAVASVVGVVYLKVTVYPVLDREVSARSVWRSVAGSKGDVCLKDVGRQWKYGLNYYSVTPLPDCELADKPLRLREASGELVIEGP